ncbi:MAG: hypothetical protein FWE67_14770 [Planctomycetaceae bacterium]|nr:hypothetical protein [Planctomycetaceae bacterium]
MPHHSNQCHCCPQCTEKTPSELDFSRRSFLAMGGVMLGGLSLSGLQTALAADADNPVPPPKPRTPLVVKPVLVHDIPKPRDEWSWRNWGGIQSAEEAAAEVERIKPELAAIKQRADYPVEFLDISTVTNISQMKEHPDMEKCDTILLYGAGHNVNGVQNFGKDVIFFQRWKSGPVYLQYEIVSPRFLRQHTDAAVLPGIRHSDIVTDKTEELDWRFRSLCGLKNTLGAKVVTIGGAGAWSQPGGVVQNRVKETWKFEYHDVNYDELGKLVDEAKADEKVMARAKKRADDYLKIPGTKLETKEDFFVLSFVLDEVFRMLMKRVDTNYITVNSCMGTIMPKTKTTACLTLTTLNDDGYLAFCESDFVVIPSGVLLGNIIGKPVFLCNPTYPHDNIITISHCTAPRKMNGKNFDPVRIVTHYESDYGAAPWVQAPLGTVTTHIAPAFNGDRWVGIKGKIVEVPFRPICRTQFDIQYEVSDSLLAERLPGFHWMTCYGDYRKEIGYALRRVGVQWDNLDEV